jgi:hypothetical protein
MKNEIIDLERFELLIQSKSFTELTKEEREWVGQLVPSAEEYESLRISELEIRQYFRSTNVTLNPETFNQLTDHLRKSRARTGFSWSLKPSLVTVLVSLSIGALGWWIGKSSNNTPHVQTMNTLVVYDTIYVASKPDTIYWEKVVYKNRPVILTRSTRTPYVSKPGERNGINMKEKEELEKLLVSGTE